MSRCLQFGAPKDIESAAHELERQHVLVVNLTTHVQELEQGVCNCTGSLESIRYEQARGLGNEHMASKSVS